MSLSPLLAACFAVAVIGDEGAPAARYLSESGFPGLHVLEQRLPGQLVLYPEGKEPTDDSAAEPPELPLDEWATWQEAREELATALKIPPREDYQQDWAIFDSQGRRISSLEGLKAASLSFVLEIGQWIWPAVRIGFEQVAQDVEGDRPKVLRTLSLHPVVFEVREFITPEECDIVMALGQSQGLEVSKGVLQSADLESGTKDEDFRTSKQTWLYNSHSPVVERLDERTANLTRVPASHNEAVQLLRYGEGNFYQSHMDWTELELYPDQKDIWLSSHYGREDRLATVFWYLNDVPEGGETIFPKHGQPICPSYDRTCPGAPDPDMASCQSGLKVAPRKGSVILWYNFHASGRGDRNALHAGCPVGKGLVKWSGNKWVHIKPLHTPEPEWDPNHPSLIRYGWGGHTGDRGPDSCSIFFLNKAAEEVDVVWWDGNGGGDYMGSIQPGKKFDLNAFLGHEFKLRQRGGQRESNRVRCKQEGGVFVLTKEYMLGWSRGKAKRQDAARREL